MKVWGSLSWLECGAEEFRMEATVPKAMWLINVRPGVQTQVFSVSSFHSALHSSGRGRGRGGEGWVRCPEGREEKRLRKGRGRAEDQAVGTFARNSR